MTETHAAVLKYLTRIMREWTAPEFLTAAVSREGVTLDPTAITLITLLANDGPQRPSALAKTMVTGASNISKLANKLITSGHVTKLADPSDARAGILCLTEKGEHIAASFVRAGDGLVAELLHDWAPEECENLAYLLQKLEASTTALTARIK